MSKTEKTLLPFASPTQPNGEGINDEEEKAAVFCIVEASREKGGGFFKKQASEKLIFLSKVYYPFWLAPFRAGTFLLDGLNVFSHTTTYPVLHDIKAFEVNLNGRSETRQVYAAFLSNNQNYFEDLKEQQKITIDGLLQDAEFTQELLDYMTEAKTTDAPVVDSVFITPALTKEGVTNMLQNIEGTRQKMLEEIADLKEVIKLLNMKTQEFLKGLQGETEAIEEEFSSQIDKAKSALDIELAKINKEYSEIVTKVSDKYTDQITERQKEILTLEKTKDQDNAEIEHAEAEIKTAAVNKDDLAEQKWKEKRSELKNQLPEMASKIKTLEKEVADIEENRKKEMFQLKQDSDTKIKDAKKALVEIETSRDAQISVCRKEMEKIEELTSNIITKVDSLAKNREGLILEFNELGIKQKRTETLLVYMPFYLSGYQVKTNKRYTYLSSSTLSDGGLGTRLKAVGKTKISQIFQPRYRKITSILNKFIALLNEDIVFSREMSEACLKANLTEMQSSREGIKNGLNSLKEKGWLSEKEVELYSQALS